MSDEAGRAVGVLDSLRKLGRTLLETLQTRLEIMVTEIEEEKARIARIAALAALAGFCLALAVNLAVLFLVVLFWDSDRLLAIGVLAGGFAAAGIALGLALKNAVSKHPRVLSATIAELRKDRKELGGQ
jgi:uncharacterized membrane protein YqjE